MRVNGLAEVIKEALKCKLIAYLRQIGITHHLHTPLFTFPLLDQLVLET